MLPQDLATPPETPQEVVEINEQNAITIDQALDIAKQEQVSLGKSTLQRWALKWKALHNESPVKAVIRISQTDRTYLLDREGFKVWLLERKQDLRPYEVLQDPVSVSPSTSKFETSSWIGLAMRWSRCVKGKPRCCA
jgi:hypothetical protein